MTLRYDSSLYSEEAIRQAVLDYAAIADIEISSSDDSYNCHIIKSKYSLKQTALEFSNYILVLSVMKECEV